MEKRATWWEILTCAGQGMTARDRRNQWVASGWIVIWAFSSSLAAILLRKDIVPDGPAGWLVAAVPIAIGLVTIFTFRRFLVQADELQRKIQLEGLAVGFGLGLVGSWGLGLIELAGGPAFGIDDSIFLMIIGYAIAVLAGSRRYS